MTPTLNGQPIPPIESPQWRELRADFDDLLLAASRHFVSDSLPVLPGNTSDFTLRRIIEDERETFPVYEVRLSNSSAPVTK